jgi:hypothetical protein
MRRTHLYNEVAHSGDRHSSGSRRIVLDRVLETISEIRDSTAEQHLYTRFHGVGVSSKPNQPEQGIGIMSQRAAPTNVGPRRYGHENPYKFSEIAVLMGDEPEVSELENQWRPDTNDLYPGIKITPEDSRSRCAFCYPLLFPYGTDDWIYQQLLHTVNVLKRQDGKLVDFGRLEVGGSR